MEETLGFLMHGSDRANQQALRIHFPQTGRHDRVSHLNIGVEINVAQFAQAT